MSIKLKNCNKKKQAPAFLVGSPERQQEKIKENDELYDEEELMNARIIEKLTSKFARIRENSATDTQVRGSSSRGFAAGSHGSPPRICVGTWLGHPLVMVPRGSQSSLMRRGRPITAVSGYQLLMLDGTSTGTDDPVVCGVLRLRQHYSNYTRFSKALPSGSFTYGYACRSSPTPWTPPPSKPHRFGLHLQISDCGQTEEQEPKCEEGVPR